MYVPERCPRDVEASEGVDSRRRSNHGKRTSVLTIIPEAGDDLADRPVLRTQIGTVGPDWNDQEVSVVVDRRLDDEDAGPYVAVLVDGRGAAPGDDAVMEFERSDYARTLAAQLLEAADVMDAMPGKATP